MEGGIDELVQCWLDRFPEDIYCKSHLFPDSLDSDTAQTLSVKLRYVLTQAGILIYQGVSSGTETTIEYPTKHQNKSRPVPCFIHVLGATIV